MIERRRIRAENNQAMIGTLNLDYHSLSVKYSIFIYLINTSWEGIIKRKNKEDFCLLSLIVMENVAK